MFRILLGLFFVIVTLDVAVSGFALAQEPAQTIETADGPVAVPEPSELAVRYYTTGNYIWIFRQIWGLALPAVILFSGFSARIRNWAQRIGRYWVLTIAVYFLLYALITSIIELPIEYYLTYVRPHAYGLSNQTVGKWFKDAAVLFGASVIIASLFLWIPYLLLQKSPKRWWLYTSLLSIPFIFLMAMIWPVFIDRWLNKQEAMQNKELEAKVLALADRAGIEGSRVYQVNKSVDTKALNAYVTGFLSTKRIVLWDTTIEKMTEDEVLAVVGHEMGHYVLNHVIQGILLSSVLILFTLYVTYRLSGAIIRRYSKRFGFTELSDIASLPLLLIFSNLVGLTIMPISLAVSRHFERESDRFGLEIYQDNRAMATAFIKLQEENLAVPRPGPLYKVFRASHPPLGERIDFANEYAPWKAGEPLKYGHLFK